jgi:hypothetical protein
MRDEVYFATSIDSRGASISLPKQELEKLGLPTECEDIKAAEPYVDAEVFSAAGAHLGTRRKRLLPWHHDIYWRNGEEGEEPYPSRARVRVKLRRVE